MRPYPGLGKGLPGPLSDGDRQAYRLLPHIRCPAFLLQMGSRREGCLLRPMVDLGLVPKVSHSESVFLHHTAQTEDGK